MYEWRRKRVKKIGVLSIIVTLMVLITACGTVSEQETEMHNENVIQAYCGAGMKEPFAEIAKLYEEKNGIKVEVTVGNAAEIKSQISASQEGDIWIAGGESELKSLFEKDLIADTKVLVKHIPVIAVSEGNPANIMSPQDLTGAEVNMVVGDAESTPIGKIGNSFLEKQGIADQVNIIANTCSSPAMITALQAKEANVAIMFKENAVGKKGIEIVDMPEINQHIMKVQAVRLSCGKNKEETDNFISWLDSDTAKKIWTDFGYELADE